jgi:nucleoprotein TPR
LNESSAIPLLHEKQRLESTLDSLQAHVAFLEDCLKSKNTDYIRLQQESRDQLVRLEFQLDQSISEKQAVSAKLASATKLEATLTDQVAQLSKDLWNVKTELADSEETRKAERHEAERLHNLQKSHIANLEHRLADVTREFKIMQNTARQAVVENDRERNELQESLEKKYQLLLQEQAQKYEAEKKKQRTTSTAIVPIPRLTAKDQERKGEEAEEEPILGITDLYQQLEETKARLRDEMTERKKWQLSFTRIRNDVMNKAPLLQRQREEYDIAMSQLAEYSERLENMIAERDDAQADAAETRKEMAQLEMKLNSRKAENHELAQQLQTILHERAKGVDMDFIVEMQSQNQRLLSDRVRLLDTIKDLEKRLESPDSLQRKLVAQNELIEKLQSERQQQEVIATKISQQRDLYRALLARHDNKIIMGVDGDANDEETSTALEVAKKQSERAKKLEQRNVELEGDLKAIRSELDALSRENENLSERCSRWQVINDDLSTRISTLERELLTSRSETARQNSDAQYHREKCTQLEDMLERSREKEAALNSRTSELSKLNADLEKSLSMSKAECAKSDNEKRHAESKWKIAETQLQTARAAEARQATDNQLLRTEIARQSSLIDSIRRIENSLSSKAESEQEVLRHQLEKATSKMEDLESRHASEVANHITRIQELEARISDLSCSNEKNQSDALTSKKELLESKTEMQKLQSEIKTLDSHLRAARRKLGEQGMEEEDSEAVLQSRVDQLEIDLASSRAEVSSLQEQAESYQRLAKANEESLLELQNLTEKLKTEHAYEVELLSKKLENSTKDSASRQEIIKELTDDLAGQRSAREQREKELEAQIMVLKTGIQNDEKDVQSARASMVELQREVEALRNDLKAAQNNYERELRMHAETCSALRAARESMEEQERLRKIAQDNIETLNLEYGRQEDAWRQEKISMQERCNLLEKSVNEAREQNRVLHSQLETLNGMVEKANASRVAFVAGDNTADNVADSETTQKLVDELREVVKLLRSENELIQAELETAKRVSERERASANVARRSLEEARSELKSLQSSSKSDGFENVALQEMTNKLKAKDEQLELLQDSNKLLREEVGKLHSSLSATQNELNLMKNLLRPVEDVQRDLNSKIAALEAEKDSLTRELESWKERVKSLVSKFNQIDPEEHKQLANKVEEMIKEKESFDAWKKATEEENIRIRQIAKNVNLKLKEHQKTIESQKESIDKLSAEKVALLNASKETSAASKEAAELQQKIVKMEKDAESAKTELLGANSRNDRLREKLREFQTIIRELRSKEKSLTEQLAATAKVAPAPTAPLAHEIQKDSTVANKSEPPARAELEVSVRDTTPMKKTTMSSTIVIPDVPRDGFKYGPSVSLLVEATAKKVESHASEAPSLPNQPTIESAQLSASSLRPSATPFVPSNIPEPEKSSISTASGGDAESKTRSVPQTAQTTPQKLSHLSEGKTARRMSGEKKEMSLKDKLLEKKRLLEAAKKAAEEKKRKLEAEKVSKDDKSTDSQNDQAMKKHKAESASDTITSSQVTKVEEKSSEESKREITELVESKEQQGESKVDEALIFPAATGIAVSEPAKHDDDTKLEPSAATEGQEQSESPFDVIENVAEESAGAMEDDGEIMEEEAVTAAETEKKTETITGIIPQAAADPFAPAAGHTTAFLPAAVVAPSAPFASTGFPASSGGAFLDMKPPGTTDTPPIFTFGTSSSIVLPTPSIQQPALSPFGAFGSSTSSHFGSVFGGVQSRPLFSAPSEPIIEGKEGEKMEDEEDEAHMDAND